MLRDQKSSFSDAQTMVLAAGSYNSTNIIDTGAPDVIGRGSPEPVRLAVQFKDLTSGGAATVAVNLQHSDTEAFGAPVTVPLEAAGGFAAANGLKQYKVPFGVQRYVRLQYVIGAAAITGGTVSAFLTKDVDNRRAYPTSIGNPRG